ncbi:MAG: hypothetical protein V3T83_04110, partial [Acidobacteriota bacterium]
MSKGSIYEQSGTTEAGDQASAARFLQRASDSKSGTRSQRHDRAVPTESGSGPQGQDRAVPTESGSGPQTQDGAVPT